MNGLLLRFSDVLLEFPARLLRLAKHFYQWKYDAAYAIFPVAMRAGFWLIELLLLILELIGIGECYDLATRIFKFRTRPLSAHELQLAQSIFGKSIRYASIRIDERAYLGPRQRRFCYVSFCSINSWGSVPDPILIHELTHIWQYQKMGICYIPRALAAQATQAGYDYGGEAALIEASNSSLGLDFFNLEQQADLIEDYFRLKHQLPLQWNRQASPHIARYEALLTKALH